MRASSIIAVFVCACTPTSTTVPPLVTTHSSILAAPLPAGPCGFDNYLSSACGDAVPSFAVVAAEARDGRSATIALAAARDKTKTPGYPFAISYDELPARDPSRRGIAIVVGLYAHEADARAFAKSMGGEIIALATPEEADQRRPSSAAEDDAKTSAIEMTEDSPAYAEDPLEKLEASWNWSAYPQTMQRRAIAVAKLPARCSVRRGDVFVASNRGLYTFRRAYVPVTCPNGESAWVPGRATRFESVVTADARIHQVLLVECDSPTLETRPFGIKASVVAGEIWSESCE